jgi:asparagine synthase (glutamine-hydrolysing)
LGATILRKATFAAVVSAAPIHDIINRIEAMHAPVGVRRIAIAGGWLTLFYWRGGEPAARNPLVTLDGSGGGSEVPLPAALIETATAPAGLREIACQHRSYLWLDEDGPLVCWTDHLALAPLYHAQAAGAHVVSDDPALLADLSPGIDDAMIASFLANGIMLGERTLFSGVRSLPPASIVTISPDLGVSTAAYWRHKPGSALWADRDEMERELWSRVTNAVTARVADRQAVISLSGGFDSSALLGILHAAGHEVSTFSFATGAPRPGSAADVARRQAELLGVAHQVYALPEPYDVLDLFKAQLGGGAFMRKPCYELRALGEATADAYRRWRDPILLFGDEAFGQGALRIETADELLGAMTLKDPALIGKLAAALPAGEATRLSGALRQIYNGMIDAIPAGANRSDTMDSAFLDMFLIANMVQIRGSMVAPHIPIALPYLDLGVLDMARHVPSHVRIDKGLFEAAAARNLPELFALRRAMTRQAQPDPTALIRANAAHIERAIREMAKGTSPLLEPSVLLSALTLARTEGEKRSRLFSLIQKTGKIAIRRKLLPATITNAVQQRIWTKFRTGVSHAALFMRLLYLAMLFEGAAYQHEVEQAEPAMPRKPEVVTLDA